MVLAAASPIKSPTMERAAWSRMKIRITIAASAIPLSPRAAARKGAQKRINNAEAKSVPARLLSPMIKANPEPRIRSKDTWLITGAALSMTLPQGGYSSYTLKNITLSIRRYKILHMGLNDNIMDISRPGEAQAGAILIGGYP